MDNNEKSCEQVIFEILQKDHERLKQAVLNYLKECPIPVCKSIIADTVTELKGADNAYKFKRIIKELIDENLVKIDCGRSWIRYQYVGEQEAQNREQITTIHVPPMLPVGAVFKFDGSDQLYKLVENDQERIGKFQDEHCGKCALRYECCREECWAMMNICNGYDRPDGKWCYVEEVKEEE